MENQTERRTWVELLDEGILGLAIGGMAVGILLMLVFNGVGFFF